MTLFGLVELSQTPNRAVGLSRSSSLAETSSAHENGSANEQMLAIA